MTYKTQSNTMQSPSNGRPTVSLVIPSWNTQDLTRGCLSSLFMKDHGCQLEVIVIDNGSHDGSADMVATEFPKAVLLRNAVNEYYSKACNQGAAVATGQYVCFLNSDTIVPDGALLDMLSFLETHPGYGAVAPRLDNTDGSVQPICRRFPRLMEVVVEQFQLARFEFGRRYMASARMKDFDHLTSRDVDQPPGACMVMRREEFLTIGGFDESLPLFYSDVDLCLRIWQSGKPIRFLAEARVAHVGSASVVRHPLWQAEFMRNQIRYFRKHMGWFAAMFAKIVVLTSAAVVVVRTILGPRPIREKRDLIGKLTHATHIAIGR